MQEKILVTGGAGF
ncbi:hypothetical protein BHN191_08677, partial [Streptococcus pneumoniae BHN191]